MTEPQQQTSGQQLVADLRALGLNQATLEGRPLIVHSGFRSLGPVEGGPATVVDALVAAAGESATILMPAFTTQLTDPYVWPVPPTAAVRAQILKDMPTFDPATTPPHKMGAIVSAFWHREGVVRSAHPVTSWLALGPLARALTDDHDLDDPEGLHGPVGRVFARDGWVLLLGVDHDANTTIHLAESLLDMPHLRLLPDRYPVDPIDPIDSDSDSDSDSDGDGDGDGDGDAGGDDKRERTWRVVAKTTKCSDGFVKLGPALEADGLDEHGTVGRHGRVGRRGMVGLATAHLFRSRDIVRVATQCLRSDPTALLCDDPECVHCPASRASLRDWVPPPVQRLG